jgi:hypothetical protein
MLLKQYKAHSTTPSITHIPSLFPFATKTSKKIGQTHLTCAAMYEKQKNKAFFETKSSGPTSLTEPCSSYYFSQPNP